MNARSQLWWVVGLVLVALVGTTACGDASVTPGPIVVIGLDGADRGVIEDLWAQDRLPHLRALAERGLIATLETFASQSPVIWTTMATGMEPEVHGITDFVVPTPTGDVPASTSVRKVPAIWNMVSHLERSVAVLGWWPTWPVEEVNGLVVSDRFLVTDERHVYPESLLPQLTELVEETRPAEPGFGEGRAGHMDRLLGRLAQRLAAEDHDLLMVYLKSIDGTSHRYWKYYRPERFRRVGEDEIAVHGDRVPAAYEALDRVVGGIVEAAGPRANVFVVSDHGFFGLRREKVKVRVELDLVLEELGYLTRQAGQVDMRRSLVYTYGSHAGREAKTVRFSLEGREAGGRVSEADSGELRRRLARDLARVTYPSGEPALKARDARKRNERDGDFVVEVLKDSPGTRLLLDGRELAVPVQLSAVSGTHNAETHGVLLAAGPDIQPDARLDGVRVHDLTPTLLFGLGLPVAQDFAGVARTELFTDAFRDRHPLLTLPSWGTRDGAGPVTSEADEELIEELRALGYLD